MTSSAAHLRPGDRVHLVGIGGAGMSALAWLLLERGHRVTGSDLRGGLSVAGLRAMGADVRVGHDAANVGDADLVAVSTAIPDHNPEVGRARDLGLPVLHRAQLLALLMQGRRGILVAGAHGKTTTTSMIVVCLQAAGRDPSFAIGGTLHDTGTSAHHGSGDLFVAEADESDRSFLAFTPHCAVVTNVDLDHHDHFADLAEVTDAFREFLARREAGAPAIVCRDDEHAAALARRIDEPVVTYGEHPEAHVRVLDTELGPTGTRFRLMRDGNDLGPVATRLLGRHNILNAAAATAAALWAGASMEDVRGGLASFSGAQRRFQRIGEVGGVTIIDDYAHNPAKLVAALAAARQSRPTGRVVAVFQPHRFSRTVAVGPELGAALTAADVVVVTDVYGAGESPVAGVTGALVADTARAAGVETHYVPSAGDVPELVQALVRPGDLVITLGAGDITETGPVLLRRLEERLSPRLGDRHG